MPNGNRVAQVASVLGPGLVAAAGVAYFVAGDTSTYRRWWWEWFHADAPVVAVFVIMVGGLLLVISGYPLVAGATTTGAAQFATTIGQYSLAIFVGLAVIAGAVIVVVTIATFVFVLLAIVLLTFLTAAIFRN